MELTLNPTHGRKQLQFYPYYYGYNNHRWIYWAVPLIAVGVFVFIVAMIIFVIKRRRMARLQGQIHYNNPPPPPVAPVTGYPDYSSQYNNDYATYNSMPPGPRPAENVPQQPPPYGTPAPGYKPNNIEMGYPQRY